MNETKEKNAAMAEEMTTLLVEFLRNNIIGFTEKREGGFAFCLPGGKKFLISVQEE
ncbi:MAG: hypothetical protein IKA20_06260 [Clostridia bacterium]|nr:hypothetical protein [Clostridia bacterium]